MYAETTVHGPTQQLPSWRTVLAVVAHPDDESFGLGAVLDAFAGAGAVVSVLCLTHGEASTVQGIKGDLRELRAAELQSAARTLGLSSTQLLDHPDGALAETAPGALAAEIDAAIAATGTEGLLVFDTTGVTGHPDHVAASIAAIEAARRSEIAVLGSTIPAPVADRLNHECGTGFVGRALDEIDLVVSVTRERQRLASLAHASQAVPTSVLWRRLDLLGDREHLRWLTGADSAS